ncbi:MAG: hypothetical protein ACFE8E_14075 [Candidatus Hodarchaeota archaeon]
MNLCPHIGQTIGAHFLRKPSQIESKIRAMISDWIQQGNPEPILPRFVQKKLFGSAQLKISNFLGTQH